MKNYKKGLLYSMILAAMSLMAAEEKTIYVNTFADEDGENLNQCALREAIKTAKNNKSYGGCNVGNSNYGQKDTIQLEEGEYLLKSELRPQSQVLILGKSPFDYSNKDVLTNTYPATQALKTKITAKAGSRIFNTLESESALSLTNVILEQGSSADVGGALLIGGALTMNNSAILNSTSAKAGGAIYVVAQNSAKDINLTRTLIQGNNAPVGSVIAMDCEANLLNTKAIINLSNSSVVKNGSSSSLSTIDLCGNPEIKLTANTIAKNIANPANGSIIRSVSEVNHRLSPSYSFAALSNTMVENEAHSTFYYDDMGSISFTFNILAFNSGKSCRYALNNGNLTNTNLKISASHNAFQLNDGAGQCDLPEDTLKADNFNLNLSSVSMSSVLSTYQAASKYNLFLPMYYPIDNQSNLDLVNVSADKCSDLDQRGLQRITNGTLMLDPSLKNSCDIGSIELMRLTAADIIDLRNQSYVTLIESYKTRIAILEEYLNNPESNKEFIAKDQEDLKNWQNLLKYSQEYAQYRAIYVDPFALTLPSEVSVLNANGATRLKELNSDNYSVSTYTYGVGEFVEKGGKSEFVGNLDPNLKCEWKEDLKRIMIYRLDGKTTSLDGFGYCSYTIRSKQADDGSVSTGVLKVDFINTAPIAKDDRYSITPSTNQSIAINPLENDSDDGDGVTLHLNVPYKGAFYKNAKGIELPIMLAAIPAGLTVRADRSGPCPDQYIKDTCYGGQLYFEVKNSFSQFDYEIEYNILDAEGLKSNDAKIDLINTAKNTNTQASGGGSVGVYGLFGLVLLAAYRSRRKK